MRCSRARDRVTSAGVPRDAAVRDHVDACAACREYAARLGVARQWFREHRVDVEPDPSFAARLAARVRPSPPTETLGWAAARLLPASLILVAILGWFAFRTAPSFVAETVSDDFWTWVLEVEENGR